MGGLYPCLEIRFGFLLQFKPVFLPFLPSLASTKICFNLKCLEIEDSSFKMLLVRYKTLSECAGTAKNITKLFLKVLHLEPNFLQFSQRTGLLFTSHSSKSHQKLITSSKYCSLPILILFYVKNGGEYFMLTSLH